MKKNETFKRRHVTLLDRLTIFYFFLNANLKPPFCHAS